MLAPPCSPFDVIAEIEVVVEVVVLQELVVTLPYPESYGLPCYAVHLLDALFCYIVVQALVRTQRVDGVGHGVCVPIVDLDDILKNLPAS